MTQQMETAAPAGGRPKDFVAAHDDRKDRRFDQLSQGDVASFRSLGEILTAALNRIALAKRWPLPFPEAGIAVKGRMPARRQPGEYRTRQHHRRCVGDRGIIDHGEGLHGVESLRCREGLRRASRLDPPGKRLLRRADYLDMPSSRQDLVALADHAQSSPRLVDARSASRWPNTRPISTTSRREAP